MIYVIVTTAAQAYAGTELLADNQDDVLAALGARRPSAAPLDKLVIIAVLTSAAASTQTTILPTARTSLSMAARKARAGDRSGAIHPRYLTPARLDDRMGGALDRLVRRC